MAQLQARGGWRDRRSAQGYFQTAARCEGPGGGAWAGPGDAAGALKPGERRGLARAVPGGGVKMRLDRNAGPGRRRGSTVQASVSCHRLVAAPRKSAEPGVSADLAITAGRTAGRDRRRPCWAVVRLGCPSRAGIWRWRRRPSALCALPTAHRAPPRRNYFPTVAAGSPAPPGPVTGYVTAERVGIGVCGAEPDSIRVPLPNSPFRED